MRIAQYVKNMNSVAEPEINFFWLWLLAAPVPAIYCHLKMYCNGSSIRNMEVVLHPSILHTD